MFRRRINVGSVRAERAVNRAVVETLEGRQLFHDGHVHVAVGVDFQVNPTPVYTGYVADTGAVYGDRGNGWTYGFSKSVADTARDRNSGKSPDELAYGRLADAQIVGSYDAAHWIREAEVVPPGIDLSAIEPVPPRADGPVRVAHAALSRRRKGTELVVAACVELGLELDVIENVRHDEVGPRLAQADIVVDQLNSGWYGLFAIEAMAYGKPVVGYIHDEAATRTAAAFGVDLPIVRTTKETLASELRPLLESAEERLARGAAGRSYVERVHDADKMADRLIDIYSRL